MGWQCQRASPLLRCFSSRRELDGGFVKVDTLELTDGSPGPSLAWRAGLPSICSRVAEMQFEIPIPTPDPTNGAYRLAGFDIDTQNGIWDNPLRFRRVDAILTAAVARDYFGAGARRDA
jgi:hypothetical protein